MILLSLLPCKECKYFDKIVQPHQTEMDEYVQCKIAKTKSADEYIKIKNKKAYCYKFKKSKDLI